MLRYPNGLLSTAWAKNFQRNPGIIADELNSGLTRNTFFVLRYHLHNFIKQHLVHLRLSARYGALASPKIRSSRLRSGLRKRRAGAGRRARVLPRGLLAGPCGPLHRMRCQMQCICKQSHSQAIHPERTTRRAGFEVLDLDLPDGSAFDVSHH